MTERQQEPKEQREFSVFVSNIPHGLNWFSLKGISIKQAGLLMSIYHSEEQDRPEQGLGLFACGEEKRLLKYYQVQQCKYMWKDTASLHG